MTKMQSSSPVFLLPRPKNEPLPVPLDTLPRFEDNHHCILDFCIARCPGAIPQFEIRFGGDHAEGEGVIMYREVSKIRRIRDFELQAMNKGLTGQRIHPEMQTFPCNVFLQGVNK
jgi:hypothetical protein